MTVKGATRRTAAQGRRGAHAADRRTQARLVWQCSAQRAVQAPPQHSQPKQRPTTTKQNPLPRADGNGTPTANQLAPTTAPRGGEKLRVPQTRASAAIRERGTKYGCPTETREGGRGGRPPLAGAPRAGRCRSRRDCGAGRRAGPAWPCVLGRLTLLYCPARRRKGGSRQTATVQWCAAVLLQLSNGMHPHDSLSWGFDPDCEPDTRLASQSGASKSPVHTVQ